MAPAPLNAEPSQLEERIAHHLQPKSYVEAAEENLNGSHNETNETPSQYVGQGEDDAPRSPLRKPHKKSSSLRINGLNHKTSNQSILVENYQDKDGQPLTSVKPKDFEENVQLSAKGRAHEGQPQHSELVSGRRAGANWERKCEHVPLCSHPPLRLSPLTNL